MNKVRRSHVYHAVYCRVDSETIAAIRAEAEEELDNEARALKTMKALNEPDDDKEEEDEDQVDDREAPNVEEQEIVPEKEEVAVTAPRVREDHDLVHTYVAAEDAWINRDSCSNSN